MNEVDLIVFIQKLWFLYPLFKGLSFLGSGYFYFFVLFLLFFSGKKKLSFALALLLLLESICNLSLKYYFMAPRPYYEHSIIQALSSDTGFWMPSGHAQNSLFYLFLYQHQKKTPLFLFLLFLINFSRIALGMHYSSQILAGLGIGLLVYFIHRKILPFFQVLFQEPNQIPQFPWKVVGILFAVACILALPAYYYQKTFSIPIHWQSNSLSKGLGEITISPNTTFALLSLTLFFPFFFFLEEKKIAFSPSKKMSFVQMIVLFLFNIVFLIILRVFLLTLSFFFRQDIHHYELSLGFYLLQSPLILAFILLFLPWILKKWDLMNKDST